MSRFGDYEDDMQNGKFSDADIELLLSGAATPRPELEGLTSLFAMLRADGNRIPTEESAAKLAVVAAEVARALRAGAESTLQPRTLPRARESVVRGKKRLVAFGAGLMLASMTGAAFASNGAAPGDALYGVDLAFERVGVGAGGATERLSEVEALTSQNKPAQALQHATTVIAQVEGDESNEEALAGLQSAIAELTSIEEGSDHAKEVRANVAAMLQWMIDNAALANDPTQPGAFGRGVASMAGAISDEDNEADAADAADAAADAADAAADAAERAAEGEGDGPPEGVTPGLPAGVPPNRP